jgi:hypothetical protein
MTVSPNTLNCVPISVGDNPVTVKALEAINSASINPIGFLPVQGKNSNKAPIKVVDIKASDNNIMVYLSYSLLFSNY